MNNSQTCIRVLVDALIDHWSGLRLGEPTDLDHAQCDLLNGLTEYEYFLNLGVWPKD